MTKKVGLYHDKRNKHQPWVVRWFGEYDPAKGKERHYSKAFKRKRAAEVFRAAKQAELDRGSQRDLPQDISLGEFIERFIATKGRAQRVATRNVYQKTFDQLQEYFGGRIPISRITPELADRFVATRQRVAKHGEGFSPASRNQHLRNCKAAFRVAVEWGYLQRNPFDHIKQEKASPQNWHHLKPKEFQAVLNQAEDLRWQAFYILAYTTGARCGELFNLTWKDVDFERATVIIRDQPATAQMPPFRVKDHEARTLLLPKQAIDALLAWHAEAPEGVPYIFLRVERWQRVCERWQLCRDRKPWKLNPKTGKLEWVEWENRYMVNNVLRTLRTHVRRAKLKPTAPLTVHTLRKSFAQNHANAGTPSATLKALMGHASIITTEKYYLQRSDETQRAAVKRYEGLLPKKTCVRLAYKGSKAPQPAKAPEPSSSQSAVNSELT